MRVVALLFVSAIALFFVAGVNATEDSVGVSGDQWWLQKAPWFLPPPPEWGPMPVTMYTSYFHKPTHPHHLDYAHGIPLPHAESLGLARRTYPQPPYATQADSANAAESLLEVDATTTTPVDEEELEESMDDEPSLLEVDSDSVPVKPTSPIKPHHHHHRHRSHARARHGGRSAGRGKGRGRGRGKGKGRKGKRRGRKGKRGGRKGKGRRRGRKGRRGGRRRRSGRVGGNRPLPRFPRRPSPPCPDCAVGSDSTGKFHSGPNGAYPLPPMDGPLTPGCQKDAGDQVSTGGGTNGPWIPSDSGLPSPGEDQDPDSDGPAYTNVRPQKPEDIEDCVACRYIWLQVEQDVGNTQVEADIFDAFSKNCKDAIEAKIFFPACTDMFQQADDMIGDYMDGYTVNQLCENSRLCRK